MTQTTSDVRTDGLGIVPVIDISPYFSGSSVAKREVAKMIDAACRDVGFLVIAGHGVPSDLIRRAQDAARRFFDLDLEVKKSYPLGQKGSRSGYSAMESTTLALSLDDHSGLPDYRELYTINRVGIDFDQPYYRTEFAKSFFAENVFPEIVPDFAESWQAYYGEMERLAVTLMRLFALALNLDEHFFDNKIDHHISNFCGSNYPDQLEAPPRGQIRAGAHSDYGSLTILKTEDKPGGLEICTKDGIWAPVPIVPDTFIINIGDLMAQWTNDRWISTLHRVVNPPRDQAVGSRRLSLIFFHQPNYDARVECLPSCLGTTGAKYAPITSGAHLISKLEKSGSLPPEPGAAE